MANDDFNWDEVLVTTKPDSKEVEVSFKRVDGGGFFQNESGPGTPPGSTEDPDGCRNTATLYSEDVFLFRSNEPHYVWLMLKNAPTEYMEVDITFSDGDMTYPDYTTQSLTYALQPGGWTTDAIGMAGKKIPLMTGDLSAKIDAGTDSGLYYAQITAVRNFGEDSCFAANNVTINFGPTSSESDPDDDTETGGDPIEPPPDPACIPGGDCDSRWNRTETFAGTYDGVLLLREGYADYDNPLDGYHSNEDPILNVNRAANQFVLTNKDRTTTLFDGNADSTLPDLEGNESSYVAVAWPLGYSNGVGNPADRVGSIVNAGTTSGGIVYRSTDDMYFQRFSYPNGTQECESLYFGAPTFDSLQDWRIFNDVKANNPGQGIWPEMVNVADPTNIDSALYAPDGVDYVVDQWFSVFAMGPYIANRSGALNAHKPTALETNDPAYPYLKINSSDGTRCYVHNGLFGGNDYQMDTYSNQAALTSFGAGRFRYQQASGNGGQESFDSPFYYTDRDKACWYTCNIETYYKSEYKDNNNDGDFGLYNFGIVQYKQRFATWYCNGRQVTPRHLISNFSWPTGYDKNIPVEDQLGTLDFASKNYMRGGFPMEDTSHANATFVTRPISYSSRSLGGFGATAGQSKVQPTANYGLISSTSATSGYVHPVLAYVDHSDIANQFFVTDQYAAMRTAFDKATPAYCARRP